MGVKDVEHGSRGSRQGLLLCCAGSVLLGASITGAGEAAPPSASSKEYDITVDATALTPLTRWQVPGVTPYLMSLDPEYSEAYPTTESRVVRLKPGQYRFGTFTFDFSFEVTLEGVLDFAPSLDQCIDGRGTRTLTVRCSRTQPYGGQPEY